MYQQFAITICDSVLISAFVSLELGLALYVCFAGRPSEVNWKWWKGLNKVLFTNSILWLNAYNRQVTTKRGLRNSIKRAPLVLILLVCIYAGTYASFQTKANWFLATEDEGRVTWHFQLPEGSFKYPYTSSDAANEYYFRGNEGINHVTGIGGLELWSTSHSNPMQPRSLYRWIHADWAKRLFATALEELANIESEVCSNYRRKILVVVPPPVKIPGLGNTGGFSVLCWAEDLPLADIKEFEGVLGQCLAAINQRPEIARAFMVLYSQKPGLPM